MTEVDEDIKHIRELDGGVIRIVKMTNYSDILVEMPDGKVFELKGGVHHGIYGSNGFIDATRVK